MGFAHAIGVMYAELVIYFNASRSDTSWIASLGSGFMHLLGPFAGIVEERYGCRAIGVLGSLLIGVGMVSSAFANELYVLYITFGIISGIGFCFSYIAASVAVNVYFKKRRGLATGIAMSGVGFCSITVPILSRYLIDVYAWRGAFLLLAGMCFQGLYCGLLFGAIRTSSTESPKHKEKQTEYSNGHFIKADANSSERSIKMKTKKILKSRKFLLYLSSSVLVTFVYFVPYVMLPDMVAQHGISETDAALMLTVSGIASTFCRIIFGLLADVPGWNSITVNGVILILLGVTTGTVVVFNDRVLFYVYSTILGACTGIFGVYQAVIVADIVGKNLVGLAIGYMMGLEGIAAIIGPPLAGLLFDITENYQLTFVSCGICFCGGGILSILASIGTCKTASYRLDKKSYKSHE